MAHPTINAVGFCAHYSEQGDWAFDYALKLSKRLGIRLNVFHFLEDPYASDYSGIKHLSKKEIEDIVIKKEKELRIYYDERAGEYLDVGFRVCYDNAWKELHQCLIIREFQILVLGYPDFGASFTGRTIEDFANKFITPVVLVGPAYPEQYYLNSRAVFMKHNLGLKDEQINKLILETA